MKKIFSIMAAAVIALTFASCNNQGGQGGATSFKITVDEVTFNSAHVAVVPADTTVTYYWDVFPAEAIAQMTDDSLANYVKEYLDYLVEYYKYFGYDVKLSDLLYKGADDYDFTGLDAETDYIAFALQMKEDGTPVGKATKKDFRTTKMEIVGHETIALTGVYDDEVAAQGWYQIMAFTADSSIYISLSPDPVSSLTQAITFDMLDLEWSYLRDYVAYEQYELVDANYTASLNGDILTATGKLVASNAIEYTFTAVCEPYVEEEGAPAKAPKKGIAPAYKLSSKALKGLKK